MARFAQVVPLSVVLPTSRVQVPLNELGARVQRIEDQFQASWPDDKAARHRAEETMDAIDTWIAKLPKGTSAPGYVMDAYEKAYNVRFAEVAR